MQTRPPRSTLFPYPTLFRSHVDRGAVIPYREVRVGRAKGEAGAAQLARATALLGAQAEGFAPLEELKPSLPAGVMVLVRDRDRKSTRLNSSHQIISYAVFCL